MFNKKFSLDELIQGRYGPFIILALVVFAVYSQALFFDFSYLDDQQLILENFNFISNPANFFEAFRRDVFYNPGSGEFYYRPLVTISFMLDALIGGANPFVFHLTNVVLHLMAVYLLFIFLQKLNYSRWSSFLVSLFFAIHPLANHAATWLPGRTETLLVIPFLISFIFLIKYFRDYRIESLFWHLIFLLLALFAKETTLFAPLIFGVYLFIQKKAVFDAGQRSISRLIVLVIGWLGTLILWAFMRGEALGYGATNISLREAWKSLINNLAGIFFYLGKTLFPFNLSVYPVFQDSSVIYGVVAALLLTVLVFLSRKSANFNKIIFGFLWFLFFIIPSFLRPNQPVALDFTEPRIYLPFIGLLIVFLEINWSKIFTERYLKVLLFLIIIGFIMINIFFGRVFDNKISFWESAVWTSPHAPLAHRNLGAMYWLDGRIDEAKSEYEKALELNPDERMAHNNLGLIYASKGNHNKAIEEYLKELEINPYYDNALYNLGLAYWALGKKDEAVQKWKETIAVNPDYLDAYRALINFYQGKGDKILAQQYLDAYIFRGGEFSQ